MSAETAVGAFSSLTGEELDQVERLVLLAGSSPHATHEYMERVTPAVVLSLVTEVRRSREVVADLRIAAALGGPGAGTDS